MSNRAEIMAEIERLEGELRRISNELDVLRRKVEPARSGRTQAFPSPVAPISSKPALAHSKTMPTSEIPSTQPSPSAPVRTQTRTLPPSEATQAKSSAGSTGRRVASPAIDIDSDPPAAPNPHPSRPARRDSPGGEREMGRYGFVSDKSKGASRR